LSISSNWLKRNKGKKIAGQWRVAHYDNEEIILEKENMLLFCCLKIPARLALTAGISPQKFKLAVACFL